jgi:4-hydroxyproline epimerase
LPGQVWTQASVIGSRFQSHFSLDPSDASRIVPTIRGSAHVCAEATLLITPSDPFAWGIRA